MHYQHRFDVDLDKRFNVFIDDALVVFHPCTESYIEVSAFVHSEPIVSCEPCAFRFGSCDYHSARVYVYGEFDDLFVSLQKGALVVGKFNLKRLKFSSSRAHFTLFGTSEYCDIKTAMGNIEIKHPCDGTVSTWVGKVNVAGGCKEPLLVNTIAGDVCAPKRSKIMCNIQHLLHLY